MARPLSSRITDMVFTFIGYTNNNQDETIEDIEDIDPCSECSDPCSTHKSYSSFLRINRTKPLQGTVKPYYKHVLISTGELDWKSRNIEDEDGSLASELNKAMKGKNGNKEKEKEKKIKGRDKKSKDKTDSSVKKKPKILLTNSSRKNDDDDPLFSEGNDVLLFLDNIIIRRVSPKHAVEFYNQFLRKNESSSLSLSPNVTFTVESIPYMAVILICSHAHRDKRCGDTAPFLKDEFDRVLKDKGLDIESRNDGIVVYMTSHIGGHKFAGNVIVYRGGQGIWYGRVIPCHVKSIVENTAIEGKIIKDLYRGSITKDFEQGEQGENS